MILIQMTERPLTISLHYRGPSVEDGTMSVSDVLSALQGFAGAYGKVASRVTPQVEHRLRVAAINHESWEMLLFSLAVLGTPPSQQQLIEIAFDAGRRVMSGVVWLIKAKKHTKGQKYDIKINGDGNTVNILNADGAKLEMPREMAELFRQNVAGPELGRIAWPLRKNEIESAVISTKGLREEITERITESDRGSFESVESSTTTISKGVKVEGFLVSLNKERNKGVFRLQDGTTIPYDYHGGERYSFHEDFGYRGPIRAIGDVSFDENLRPGHIGIISLERLQPSLPFEVDDKPPR